MSRRESLKKTYGTDIGTFRVTDIEQFKKTKALRIETFVGSEVDGAWFPFHNISPKEWGKFLREHNGRVLESEESPHVDPAPLEERIEDLEPSIQINLNEIRMYSIDRDGRIDNFWSGYAKATV